MKKTLSVLMMVLLAAMLIVSCDDNGSSPKTINITYELDGGKLADGVTNPSTATTGETITPTAPEKDDTKQTGVNATTANFTYQSVDITTTYTFKGWKVKGSNDSTASTSFTAGTEDVTLVAVWSGEKTYSNGSNVKLFKDTVSPGSTVTLGKYNKDIKWTVLTVDGTNNKALLIASDIIVEDMSHLSTYGTYSWSGSLIKGWFDNTGDEGFLSQCDLKGVKMVSHSDTTVGTVFVLSKSEFENDYNSIVKDFTGHWWLRDVNDSDGHQCWYVADGTPKVMSAQFNTGVRPAFWIECH